MSDKQNGARPWPAKREERMPEGKKLWIYWEMVDAEAQSLFFVLDFDEKYIDA